MMTMSRFTIWSTTAGLATLSFAVLGAYGHSRIRERILGGVTREMLLRSPKPLLLAH